MTRLIGIDCAAAIGQRTQLCANAGPLRRQCMNQIGVDSAKRLERRGGRIRVMTDCLSHHGAHVRIDPDEALQFATAHSVNQPRLDDCYRPAQSCGTG